MSYEAQRKVLWNAAARLDADRQAAVGQVELYQRWVTETKARIVQLDEDSANIKSTAEVLGLMDKARMTMKPDGNPQPTQSSPTVVKHPHPDFPADNTPRKVSS